MDRQRLQTSLTGVTDPTHAARDSAPPRVLSATLQTQPPAQRPPRRVTVAGVSGGVGTTTMATALGALDCGVATGRPVDVLVCRATGESVIRAGHLTQRIAAAGHPHPVVAVTSTGPGRITRPVAERIRLLEPHAAAVVVVPFMRRWHEVTDPLAEVTGLLTRSPHELTRPVRRYAAALRQVRAVLDRRGISSRPLSARPAARPVPATSAHGRTHR